MKLQNILQASGLIAAVASKDFNFCKQFIHCNEIISVKKINYNNFSIIFKVLVA